jgi:hypothetical protein
MARTGSVPNSLFSVPQCLRGAIPGAAPPPMVGLPTVDGAKPTTASQLYVTPLLLSVTTTLKARAIPRAGALRRSPQQRTSYRSDA